MFRFFLSSLFFLTIIGAGAQQMVSGTVNSTTGGPIPFVHLSNSKSGQVTTTNAKGNFSLYVTLGDTIAFSCVGYQGCVRTVEYFWFTNEIRIELSQDTTLLKEVVISEIPPEEVFKKRILDHQSEEETFWYHGMEKPLPYDNSPLSDRVINNPVFAITHPTDFLYYKFSKQEKEKRKYHQIKQLENSRKKAYQKFNREWVHDMTGLEGEELTSFIEYCDYSLKYLEETPQYLIMENMLAKLSEFKKDQKS